MNSDLLYEANSKYDVHNSGSMMIYQNKHYPKVVLQAAGKTFYGVETHVFQIFNALLEHFNFSITWVHANDDKAGAFDPKKGKWIGIVGLLAENEAETSIE